MGYCILVADDDDAYARILLDMLAEKGYETERASDAAQSVALIARRVPNLAIVDMQMPGGGGPAVVRALRSAAPLRPPPVIVCSGMPPDKTSAWFEDAAGLLILQKPVDFSRLGDEVDRLMRDA